MNHPTWIASTAASIASYLLESAATATGTWTTVASVAHSLTGSNYDVAAGVFFYDDDADPSTWYRVSAVDTSGSASIPGPAFKAPASAPLVSLEDARDWLGEAGASDARLSRLILVASREACSAVGFDIHAEFGGAVPEDIQQGVLEHVRAMHLGRGFGKGEDQSPYSVTMPNHTRDVLARYRYRLWRFAL